MSHVSVSDLSYDFTVRVSALCVSVSHVGESLYYEGVRYVSTYCGVHVRECDLHCGCVLS